MVDVNNSFSEALEYVKLFRKKNQLKREMTENASKIRDNQKRLLLLGNLQQYITDDMTVRDIKAIISNMADDYENRIDDYIIKNAEMSKERRDLSKQMKELSHHTNNK